MKESIIKDVRNLFILKKLKKEINDNAIKDVTNFFRLKKENKVIKDSIIIDIRILFEHGEEENSYKPIRVSNFWSNNYINVKVIEIKYYQLKNVLIKLGHI